MTRAVHCVRQPSFFRYHIVTTNDYRSRFPLRLSECLYLQQSIVCSVGVKTIVLQDGHSVDSGTIRRTHAKTCPSNNGGWCPLPFKLAVEEIEWTKMALTRFLPIRTLPYHLVEATEVCLNRCVAEWPSLLCCMVYFSSELHNLFHYSGVMILAM